jgi:hypothetical protein
MYRTESPSQSQAEDQEVSIGMVSRVFDSYRLFACKYRLCMATPAKWAVALSGSSFFENLLACCSCQSAVVLFNESSGVWTGCHSLILTLRRFFAGDLRKTALLLNTEMPSFQGCQRRHDKLSSLGRHFSKDACWRASQHARMIAQKMTRPPLTSS